MKNPILSFLCCLLTTTLRGWANDSTTIFNEIMYHPLAGQPEWVELYNEMSVDMDLSGWRLTGGVNYTFPDGTVIAAGGYVLVSDIPAAMAVPGVLGPWTGSLNNSGETVRLHNVSGRIMDELVFNDNGDWPPGADGSGASLARRTPGSATAEPASWAASLQIGGTPAGLNFPSGPLTGPPQGLFTMSAPWLYNESGANPGPAWAQTNYTAGDGGWLEGAGVLAFTPAALPAPVLTVLGDPAINGNASWFFQKTFNFTGDPGRTLLTLKTLVDDGAVFYLNGFEAARLNMPEGAVAANTRAAAAVGTPAFVEVNLPAEHLLAGANVLSVSVHQQLPPPAALITISGGGLTLVEEGSTMDAATNLALASKGAVPFAKNSLSATRAADKLNNGTYGNTNSWCGNTANSFCGVSLGAVPVTLRSIAFGRDNNGVFLDHTLSLYTVQYTTVANPSAATVDGDWTTIGTLNYQSAGGPNFATPAKRHRFNFTPVNATGIRLITAVSGICVDELELYAANGGPPPAPPVTLAPASGHALTWNGNNGDHAGGLVPDNLALASNGAAPFGSGELGPSLGLAYHLISNINDGSYGNIKSWIGANAAGQFIGVRFPGPVKFNSVAWGRDNTGTYSDRSFGTYTIQYTTVASPGISTGETGNATTGWASAGTATYNFRDPTFTEALRHEYKVTLTGGAAISATGLRIKVSDPGLDLDELEVYGVAPPDVVFGAELTAKQILPSPADTPVVINEIAGTNEAVWKLELKNTGSAAVSLAGFSLNGHALPPAGIAPGALLVVTETELGWRPAADEKLFLTAPGGGLLVDAVKARATSRARSGLRWLAPSAPTFGAENVFALHSEIVINEIMAHFPPFSSTLTTPVLDNPEQWVELFNKSAGPVDVGGWKLDDGISMTLPAPAVIPAGGYLVVANNAAQLTAKWPEAAAVIRGNFSGKIKGSGERIVLLDSAGNPADEARYLPSDGNDGGGSSQELRDPRASHATVNSAWADSDESGKSTWQTMSYRLTAGQTFGPTTWNEIRLGMLDAGECLVDDLSVVRDPDGARVEVIQNGNFEASATHWRFLGNHRTSAVITEPGNAANHVLKVAASGPAETNHNHIEGTLSGNTGLTNDQTYEVSFRARWLAGTNQLNVKAYYAKLARTTELVIPPRLGTPGASNSRAVAHLGPTFSGLRHDPVIPAAGQSATVSVAAASPDGVASVSLFYRADGAAAFSTVPMSATGSTWSAAIPTQPAGTIVQFYVQAVDTLAAAGLAPAAGAQSRALVQWADGQGTSLPAHELRLIMLTADRNFLLDNMNRLSNERQPGTLIYRRSEPFYDIGVRLQGTAAGRVRDGEAYVGYDLSFPPDHLFRGVHSGVGIDRSGRAPAVRQQDEIYVRHVFHRAGIPCAFDDLCYFISPQTIHTGTGILQMAVYGPEWASSQFAGKGTVFNFDVTYDPTTTTDGQPESLKPPVPFIHVATDFADLGNDKEQYRGAFDIRAGKRRDDYTGIMQLCKNFALPDASLPAQLNPLLDVDEVLRCTALVNLWSIGDTYYTGGFQHNLRLFVPDDGSPVTFLPWDMDFVMSNGTTAALAPTSSSLGRFINNVPENKRRYLGHVRHLCATAFKSSYLSPWLTSYGAVVGQNFSVAAAFMDARCAYAATQFPANAPYAITTNGGAGFSVAAREVVLEGTGWIDIHAIHRAGSLDPLAITWPTLTTWRATLPLVSGPNAISLEALDFDGAIITTRTITVTNTLVEPVPRDFLRITELHYHPANPSTLAELSASPGDSDFEFIEVKNTGAQPLLVGGVHFSDAVDFTVPTGTTLGGGQFAVIVRKRSAFEARYGTGITILGEYLTDAFSNGGELVSMLDSTGAVIQNFTYHDSWFPSTDGPGWSLVAMNENATAPDLNSASSWAVSYQRHGNPGSSNGPLFSTEYQGWRHQNFTAAELDDPLISGAGAAPGGLPNLLRYALGLSRTAPPSAGFSLAPPNADGIRFSFRRLRRPLDLTYLPESSPDLAAWSPDSTPVSVTDNGDGTETVVVSFAPGLRKYVRLRVQTVP